MPQIYKRRIQIRFREGDPARILYSGNLFSLAHDTFEEFIQQALGLEWKDWFLPKDAIVPIRHTECDFLAPFLPGEFYDVQVLVAKFGKTSMQMKYVFTQGERTHAVLTMVHAFLDPKTKEKMEVPAWVRAKFSPYLEEA